MKDKKNLIIGILVFAIIVMAAGYAVFSTSLASSNQVKVTSSWDVSITDCKRVGQSSAEEVEDINSSPSYTITTATLDTELKNVDAWAEYEITVSNKGSVDAELDTANVLSAIQSKVLADGKTEVLTGDYVNYEITQAPATKLSKESSTTMKIKVKWDNADDATVNSIEEKLTVNVVYKQAK